MSEHKPEQSTFLRPVEAVYKVDLVVQQITNAVLNGDLQPGVQLPSEREIAASLGVSRAIVREAYSALQVAGMIERRTGAGSYIKDVSNPDILRSRAVSLLQAGPDPYEVWVAREAIEPGLAPLCIANATDQDMDCLLNALETLERGAEAKDWVAYFEGDRTFHSCYALATHNASVISIMEQLGQEMRNPLMQTIKESYFLSDEPNVEFSERVHRRIYSALVERDAAAASEAMRDHFRLMGDILGY